MLILPSLLLATAAATGEIAPALDQPGESCHLSARAEHDPNALAIEGPAPLALAPGTYALRVTCSIEGQTHSVYAPSVRVFAARTAKPRLSLAPVRARVMARREGALLAASVELHPPGETLDPPLYVFPANQTVRITAGRYDLRVRANEHPIEARWPHRFAPGKLVVFDASLDDGTLEVVAEDNGRVREAVVRVFPEHGNTDVAQGSSRERLRLAPARYRVTAALSDAVDFDEREAAVTVSPGRKTRVKLAFRTGRLALRVLRDGKSIPTPLYLRLPNADDFFASLEAPRTVSVRPGRLQISAQDDESGATRTVEAEVQAGRETKVTLDLSPAEIRSQIERAAGPIAVRSIELEPLEGSPPPTPPDADGVLRAWPGTYRFRLSLEDGQRFEDTPFQVDFGQKVLRKVALPHGVLALRAPPPKHDFEVRIFRPGESEPLRTVSNLEQIALDPGRYDVRVTRGPNSFWRPGIAIVRGKIVTLALDETKPEPPLPEGEDPVYTLPEGDAR